MNKLQLKNLKARSTLPVACCCCCLNNLISLKRIHTNLIIQSFQPSVHLSFALSRSRSMSTNKESNKNSIPESLPIPESLHVPLPLSLPLATNDQNRYLNLFNMLFFFDGLKFQLIEKNTNPKNYCRW